MTARFAARRGDAVGHHRTGVPRCKIAEGCTTVLIENEYAARVTDGVSHDARLTTGSATVLIAGLRASRNGDEASCSGHVLTHASRTIIGR